MEITNIIISNSFVDFLFKNSISFIIVATILIFVIGGFFLSIQQDEKGIFFVLIFFGILFTICLFTFTYIDNYSVKPTDFHGLSCDSSIHDTEIRKYIVEYNTEDSKKTMTTKEIVNAIYKQKYFQEKKEKTSKVVILIRGSDNQDLVERILWMQKNTLDMEYNKKLNEQKENEQKENDKFLNETHIVDTKQ